MAAFAVLKEFIIVNFVTMGPFQPGDKTFQTVEELAGYVQSQQLSGYPLLDF